MSWQQLIAMFVDVCIYRVKKIFASPYMKMLVTMVSFILLAAVFSALASTVLAYFLM